MRKIYFSLFLIFLVSFLAPFVSFGSEIDELKNKIEDRAQEIKKIEKEISEYQGEIQEQQNKAGTLKTEMSYIENKVKGLTQNIKLNENQIKRAELMIAKLSLEIGDKELKIKTLKKEIEELLRLLVFEENLTPIEFFLKYENFSNFFDNLYFINNLETNLYESLSSVLQIRRDLENAKEEQGEEKTALEGFTQELEDRKLIQNQLKNEKDRMLTQTKNQEAVYQKLLKEREEQRAKIQEEISQIEEELRKLIDPASLPAKRPGILAWPVKNPFITQGFGWTEFAKANSDIYGKTGHNGVDFRASMGTPIYAAEKGEVRDFGDSDKYCPGGAHGKWILIMHENNLATSYNHLSFIKVRKNQGVERGELVAYSGDSGYTTGPHLHFTVYDARTVQIKPSRVCGILPYGGYLNPLDYL